MRLTATNGNITIDQIFAGKYATVIATAGSINEVLVVGVGDAAVDITAGDLLTVAEQAAL